MQQIWPQVTSLIYKTVFEYLLYMLDHSTCLENSNHEETESLFLSSLQSEEQKSKKCDDKLGKEKLLGLSKRVGGDFIRSDITSVWVMYRMFRSSKGRKLVEHTSKCRKMSLYVKIWKMKKIQKHLGELDMLNR